MKKRYVAILSTLLVFGGYFAILALLVSKFSEFTPVFYTLIAFDVLALAAQIGTFFLFITEPPVEEYFFRIPSIRFGAVYTTIQYIVGFILAFIDLEMFWVLILELLILCVCGAIQCYMIYVGLHAKDVKHKAESSIAGMRAVSERAKAIMDSTDDYEWKRMVKSVYESIRYADPVQKNETLEQSVYAELSQIENAVMQKDKTQFEESCQKIRRMLAGRSL